MKKSRRTRRIAQKIMINQRKTLAGIAKRMRREQRKRAAEFADAVERDRQKRAAWQARKDSGGWSV
jgi:hypothetical protein